MTQEQVEANARRIEPVGDMFADTERWTEPQWFYAAGFYKHGDLCRYYYHSADRVRQAYRDGIPQVAPILVALRCDPKAAKERLGQGTWKFLHHSEVITNAWRARIMLMCPSFPMSALLALPVGSLREVPGMLKASGLGVVSAAATIATNRATMREAVMLVRDTERMGGKIDARWSMRRLREEHDRRSKEWAEKTASVVVWGVPWGVSIDGYRFDRLVSDADFAAEGRSMHHCVASYTGRARQGTEVVFRITGKARATVSFCTKPRHVEIKGPMNAAVSAECRDAAMRMWSAFMAPPQSDSQEG